VNEETKETKEQPRMESGPRRVYRSVVNRRIAGVCGGVAEYLNIDPLIVRLVWFLAIFVNGIGFFAYIAGWIIIPESQKPVSAPPRPPSRNSQYIWGAALVLLGFFFLADKLDLYFLVPWHWHHLVPYWFNWGVFFSVFVILLGVLLILRGNSDFSRKFSPPSTKAETAEHSASQQAGETPTERVKLNGEKRLTRTLDDRIIGGVCGGLAKYFNIDPAFVRIGWVLITFITGFLIGVVTYIVMMIVVPEEGPVIKVPAPPVGNTMANGMA
jgi:phage shock protein PspC (stress-responsive transcriptional regulator)